MSATKAESQNPESKNPEYKTWIIDRFEPSDGRKIAGVKTDHRAELKFGSTYMLLQFGSYGIDIELARRMVQRVVHGLNEVQHLDALLDTIADERTAAESLREAALAKMRAHIEHDNRAEAGRCSNEAERHNTAAHALSLALAKCQFVVDGVDKDQGEEYCVFCKRAHIGGATCMGHHP